MQLEFANDDLTLAKIHILKNVAIDMRNFLTTLQADRPMAVFLHDELISVLKHLLSRVLTDSALAVLTSGSKLINVALTNSSSNSTLKIDANVCIGSAAVAALKKLKTEDEPKKTWIFC